MRPNKPGYWWYRPIRGEAKIAYLAKGYAPYLCVVEDKIIGIHQFESQSNFKQWLGPAQPPTVREPVSWFAQQMESKLIKNDHKVGWRHMTYRDLQRRIKDELEELYKAIFWGEGNVISEAADVANFCMMIADNWRHQNNG